MSSLFNVDSINQLHKAGADVTIFERYLTCLDDCLDVCSPQDIARYMIARGWKQLPNEPDQLVTPAAVLAELEWLLPEQSKT